MKTVKYSMIKGIPGYTLIEILVATALFGLVAAGGYLAFSHALRLTRAGEFQVHFTSMGRAAAQKIARYVERGKAVGVSAGGLTIIMINLTSAQIRFQDGDGDISSVKDNCLIYDPDTTVAGNEEILCSHVSSIAGEPMFSIIAASPSAARVHFHVGDGTNIQDADFSGTGAGYQGIEVRVSATPRNLQRWHD